MIILKQKRHKNNFFYIILLLCYIITFLSGCITVDEHVPKEKGMGNTILWAMITAGVFAAGNGKLK